MFKRMARQNRMALLDIDLHLALQPEVLEKAVYRRHIIIILMFRRFLRLGFNQDRALEPDLVLVIDHHLQHPARLFALAAHVGVQQGLVAFAAPPQHVILTLQLECRIHAGLDRGGRKRKYFGVRVGGGTRHEPAVGKQIGGAPEQFGAGRLHLALKIIRHLAQTGRVFGKILAFGAHIGVVKAEIRGAKDCKHLKRCIGLDFRMRHRLAKPRAVKGLAAKRVATRPGKRMPIGHGKAQMVAHGFAAQHFGGVIVPERIFVVAVRAFIGYSIDTFEKISHLSLSVTGF